MEMDVKESTETITDTLLVFFTTNGLRTMLLKMP